MHNSLISNPYLPLMPRTRTYPINISKWKSLDPNNRKFLFRSFHNIISINIRRQVKYLHTKVNNIGYQNHKRDQTINTWCISIESDLS